MCLGHLLAAFYLRSDGESRWPGGRRSRQILKRPPQGTRFDRCRVEDSQPPVIAAYCEVRLNLECAVEVFLSLGVVLALEPDVTGVVPGKVVRLVKFNGASVVLERRVGRLLFERVQIPQPVEDGRVLFLEPQLRRHVFSFPVEPEGILVAAEVVGPVRLGHFLAHLARPHKSVHVVDGTERPQPLAHAPQHLFCQRPGERDVGGNACPGQCALYVNDGPVQAQMHAARCRVGINLQEPRQHVAHPHELPRPGPFVGVVVRSPHVDQFLQRALCIAPRRPRYAWRGVHFH